MIKEFSTHPKPQNKKARIIFLVTLLISAVVFFVSFYIEKYSGLVGLVALMLLITSILFYTKYIAVEFYYDIVIDSEGIPLFTVRQLTGRRQTTLCRIELADIVLIKKETREERKKHITPKEFKKYSYAPSVSPDVSYRIISRSRYECCELIIEGTDELMELLNSYAIEAREMRKNYLDSDEDNSEED